MNGYKVAAAVFASVVTSLVATVAIGDGLPKLLKSGDYKCKADNGYKMRACKVVEEAGLQKLVVEKDGHLLKLEGPIYPADHVGKVKEVTVEASLKEERPYICSAKHPGALEECRSQKIMITLAQKGSTWSGSYVVKHYWDKWEGKGDARKVVGYEITAERLKFTLKK